MPAPSVAAAGPGNLDQPRRAGFRAWTSAGLQGQRQPEYTPSVELSQQARFDFLSRLRSNNVEAANAVDAESRRFNFAKIASDLLDSVGLRNDDAADALTFYTGARLPHRQQ